MVLRNYVTLQPGVPARLHFVGGALVAKEITDPLTLRNKTVRALELDVDEVNGQPVVASFSVLSEKLAADFDPYLKDGRLKDYDFILTRTGQGYQTRYSVQRIPRA